MEGLLRMVVCVRAGSGLGSEAVLRLAYAVLVVVSTCRPGKG